MEEWLSLKNDFLSKKDVQKQGESLKIRKKMFAMFNKERFIVKLPKERVTELLNLEKGLPYDPGNGKIMKEWVIIPLGTLDSWMEFASEAMEYAKKLAK